MNLRQKRLQLGALVLMAAGLLGALAVFFGGTPRMFLKRDYYTILFKDAPGVVKGTPVRKSGVRIGEVESVELDDDRGMVRVRIAVDPRFSLRTNEEANIVPDLLSRDTTIDFIPLMKPRKPKPQTRADGIVPARFAQVPPDAEPVDDRIPVGERIPPGSEIIGRTPPELRAILREATDVIPTVQESLATIRNSLRRLDQIGPKLEGLVDEYTELGRAAREVIPEIRRTNDEIRATVKTARDLEPTIRGTLTELQGFARNASQVAERVNVTLMANPDAMDSIVKNVTTISQRVANLLNDENQRSFTSALKSVQSLAKSLEDIALDAKTKTLPELRDAMTALRTVLLKADQVLTPLGNRADRIVRNLDAATEQLVRAAAGFGDLLGGAGRSDGTVQRLLADPTLYNNLNDASLMLARILPRVDRVLKDVEVFADKIARHPESLGVGGAVRPNSGLKDPPGAPLPAYKPRQ